MTHNHEILHRGFSNFLHVRKVQIQGLFQGYGCVPLDEIYVPVPLRVVRSEFSLYP